MIKISSDTKYFLKLKISNQRLLKSSLGYFLLALSGYSLYRRKYWIFSKFLGKYEKLYETEIGSGNTKIGYENLLKSRQIILKKSLKTENLIYVDYRKSKKFLNVFSQYKTFSTDDAVRMRFPNEDHPDREGDLLIFQEPIYDGDHLRSKGVLYLQYNRSIYEFCAIFDLENLYKEYVLIVEPSSWGYSDISLEILLQGKNPVYVMAQDEIDYKITEKLDPRLRPIDSGAGDWIDIHKYQGDLNSEKKFDVCMVASWRKLKNHKLLFQQLSLLDRNLKIALVGYPWESRTAASVRNEQKRFYPDSMLSIFECVPHDYVFDVLSNSSLALMLSEREGANRGIYEALSTNTPVVMLNNNRGVNKNLVANGCVFSEEKENIHIAVDKILNKNIPLDVRGQFIRTCGYEVTWKKICRIMNEEHGIEMEEQPLVKSSPNIKYMTSEIKEKMDKSYNNLKKFLSPNLGLL